MTLNSAAWAIDGALLNSALARRSLYASTGGNQGVVNRGDLKVLPLETPGQGVLVTPGVGLVLNGYQTEINETYTVSNEGEATVLPEDMPPSSPSAKSYILAVTVGDPEFSQVGHPWMAASDPPAGQEETFQYVRLAFIEVAAGVTSLDVDFPAVPLARIDIPSSTTTITDAMITDLRELAQPRSKTVIGHATATGTNALNGLGGTPGDWERWPGVDVITTRVPPWAVTAKVIGFVEGAKLTKAGLAKLRATLKETGDSTAKTEINESAPSGGADRRNYNVGGEITIGAATRGQIVTFYVEGTPFDEASKGALTTTPNATSALLQVTFEEGAA